MANGAPGPRPAQRLVTRHDDDGRGSAGHYKCWWSQCAVQNSGGTASIGAGPGDIMAAQEVGTQVGAAVLSVVASGANIVFRVTPANTNSVRWCAQVQLIGVIED